MSSVCGGLTGHIKALFLMFRTFLVTPTKAMYGWLCRSCYKELKIDSLAAHVEVDPVEPVVL